MELNRASAGKNVTPSPEKEENVAGIQVSSGLVSDSADGKTSHQEFQVAAASGGDDISSPKKMEESIGIQVAGGQISDSIDEKTYHQDSKTPAELGESGGNNTPGPSETQDAFPGIQIASGRVSDSATKKNCHQCRRYKTFLVACKNQKKNKPCRIKICDKCLWTRYGDKIEEVNRKADWSCPKCRGCCNCSVCMTKRGLSPTGSLHKKTKAAKRAGSAVTTSASPKKEVLLLRWTDDWEKMNAGVSGEDPNKGSDGDHEMKEPDRSGEGQ